MNSNFSNLVKEERPDFKAYNHGLASLNVVDLISLVIQGSNAGTAQRQARQLVNICGGSLREMANRRTEELEVKQRLNSPSVLNMKRQQTANILAAQTRCGVIFDLLLARQTTRKRTFFS